MASWVLSVRTRFLWLLPASASFWVSLVIVLLEAECERAMVRARLPDEIVLLGPGGNPSEQAARLRACLEEWRSRAGSAAALLDGHH